MNSLIYYRDLANIIPEYYVVHYKFNPTGISGDYVLNYGNYPEISGNITNKQLVNIENNFGLYFNKTNPSTVTIPPHDSYKANEVFTFLLNYKQYSNSSSVIISNMLVSGGNKLGFNICTNKYNDLAIEYYRNGTDYTLLETNFNLDTKGILLIKGTSSQITLGYYNLTLDRIQQESFALDLSGNYFQSGIRIGNSISTKYFPYEGYISDFVFVNRNINDTELQILSDQFVNEVREGYVYTLFSERYSSNLPPFVSGLFGQFDQISQSCLDNSFIENTGYISGEITGEIINNNHSLSGIVQINNYEKLKEPLQQFFAGIKITGQLTGYREVQNITGHQDVKLANIYNFCKNEKIDFIIRSGLFETRQVVDRITDLTGYVEETVTIPTGTFIFTGYNSGISLNFQENNQSNIKYIYQFEIKHNLSYITKDESIKFFTNNFNTGFFVSKITDFGYEKDYIITPKESFIKSLGVEKLIINYPLSQDDIVEIYSFDKSAKGLMINQDMYLSKASKNIYIGPKAIEKSVSLNGLNQIPNINYTINGNNILFQKPDLISTDYLNFNHVINSASILTIQYSGQDNIFNGSRDFVYLNGQKLISGINYNIINNQTLMDKNNTLATGIIYAFNSNYQFKFITGNVNLYNLYDNNRFFKGSNIVWINGLQLNKEYFIEVSENDPFYNPVFEAKKTVTIYDNDNQYFNQ